MYKEGLRCVVAGVPSSDTYQLIDWRPKPLMLRTYTGLTVQNQIPLTAVAATPIATYIAQLDCRK
jgi:hypothetical protein